MRKLVLCGFVGFLLVMCSDAMAQGLPFEQVPYRLEEKGSKAFAYFAPPRGKYPAICQTEQWVVPGVYSPLAELYSDGHRLLVLLPELKGTPEKSAGPVLILWNDGVEVGRYTAAQLATADSSLKAGAGGAKAASEKSKKKISKSPTSPEKAAVARKGEKASPKKTGSDPRGAAVVKPKDDTTKSNPQEDVQHQLPAAVIPAGKPEPRVAVTSPQELDRQVRSAYAWLREVPGLSANGKTFAVILQSGLEVTLDAKTGEVVGRKRLSNLKAEPAPIVQSDGGYARAILSRPSAVAVNALAVRVHGALLSDSTRTNVLFSPYGLATTLAVLHRAAGKNSAEQFSSVLRGSGPVESTGLAALERLGNGLYLPHSQSASLSARSLITEAKVSDDSKHPGLVIKSLAKDSPLSQSVVPGDRLIRIDDQPATSQRPAWLIWKRPILLITTWN